MREERTERCERCRFFDSGEGNGRSDGACKRYAPRYMHLEITGRDDAAQNRIWPLIDATDWCGDFQPNPTEESK